MQRKSKRLIALAIAVIFLFSMTLPAFAATTGYVAQQNGVYYEYDLGALLNSYEYFQVDPDSPQAALYKHFAAGQTVAEIDSEKGYLDFNALADAYDAGNLDEYKAGTPATMPGETLISEVTAGEDGNIAVGDPKPITPPAQELKVESVSAINGTITVTMTGEGTPVADGFSFVYRIDGTGKSDLGVTNFAWDAVTKTVTFDFTEFAATDKEQSIEIGWQYVGNEKGGWTTPFVVEAKTLTVSSVSAINATTIQVVLAEAPAAEPVVGDFVVKVDGAVVAASAVAKAPNTTATYNLTIASLANKEGSLDVNGKAAAIAGSDFGYDFKKPSVASVAGIDKDHIQVVFSEKMDKTWAETAGNYVIKNITDGSKLGGGTGNPSLATLQADGKTVKMTSPASMVTFANGYVLEITAPKDVAKPAANVAANVSVIFSGIGETSTQGPAALSAVYDPSTTKTIKVTFDKGIASPVKAKITVGGAALALADQVSAATNVLTITLSAASATAFEAAGSKVVAFEEGAVKDADANSIAASTITVVEAAKLVTATYAEDTNILVLNFSSAVQTAKLDLTNILVNGQTLASAEVKTEGNSVTVTTDLTNATNLAAIESAAKANRSVEIKASAGKNLDTNGNAIAQAVYTTNFTYTDDEVAPTLVSASVNATTKTMVITFSEPVTNTTANMIELYNGTTKLFDLSSTTNDVASVTPDKNTLVVVLKTNANPYGIDTIKAVADKSKLSVKVLKTTSTGTEAVKDAAGNKFSKEADASVALAYTDQDAVKYVSTAQTGLPTNQVKVTFDKSIAAADLTTGNFTIVKSDNATVTVPVTKVVGADGNRQVILTMDDTSANFVVGYTYIVKTTAKDIYGNPVETPPTPPGKADFTLAASSATAYKLTAVAYADTNEDYTVSAGDKLTLTFDGAVSISGDVTKDDFVLSGSDSLGSFKIAAGDIPEQLVITLGSGAAITLATTTFNITATDADKHIVGANGKKVDKAGSAITIAKVDSTAPAVKKAVFYDTVNDGLLGDGDTIVITFSENIKLVDGKTLDEADFAVTVAGTTLKLKADQATVDGKTVTVILDGNTNNTQPGTSKIDVSAGVDAIADLWGNVAAAGTAVVIEKSDTTAPKFTSVSYVKGEGKTATDVEATDKIVLQIDEPVGFKADATPDKVFVLYKGTANVAIDLSANNDATDNKAVVSISNGGKTLTITLGTANVASGAGELDATPISTLTSFNVDASKTKTATDANGNMLAPAVGFGLEIAK